MEKEELIELMSRNNWNRQRVADIVGRKATQSVTNWRQGRTLIPRYAAMLLRQADTR